jgi:hypothetical protein
MIPPDQLASITSYIFTSSDTPSIGSSSTISLQMVHSTMVPHATTITTGNTVGSQAPIGTPLLFIPIPSLPPGYNSLNTSIPIPTQVPCGASGVFTPPGYNASFGFIPTPSQIPSGGSYPPFIGGSDPSGSNPIRGMTQSFTYVYQIPIGGKSNPWGKPPF